MLSHLAQQYFFVTSHLAKQGRESWCSYHTVRIRDKYHYIQDEIRLVLGGVLKLHGDKQYVNVAVYDSKRLLLHV